MMKVKNLDLETAKSFVKEYESKLNKKPEVVLGTFSKKVGKDTLYVWTNTRNKETWDIEPCNLFAFTDSKIGIVVMFSDKDANVSDVSKEFSEFICRENLKEENLKAK